MLLMTKRFKDMLMVCSGKGILWLLRKAADAPSGNKGILHNLAAASPSYDTKKDLGDSRLSFINAALKSHFPNHPFQGIHLFYSVVVGGRVIVEC